MRAVGLWRSVSDAGATQYLNPIGGRELFVREEFEQSGIELMFLQHHSFEYDTGPYSFEPGLSILDVLMWNPPQKVLDALMAHAVITAQSGIVSP